MMTLARPSLSVLLAGSEAKAPEEVGDDDDPHVERERHVVVAQDVRGDPGLGVVGVVEDDGGQHRHGQVAGPPAVRRVLVDLVDEEEPEHRSVAGPALAVGTRRDNGGRTCCHTHSPCCFGPDTPGCRSDRSATGREIRVSGCRLRAWACSSWAVAGPLGAGRPAGLPWCRRAGCRAPPRWPSPLPPSPLPPSPASRPASVPSWAGVGERWAGCPGVSRGLVKREWGVDRRGRRRHPGGQGGTVEREAELGRTRPPGRPPRGAAEVGVPANPVVPVPGGASAGAAGTPWPRRQHGFVPVDRGPEEDPEDGVACAARRSPRPGRQDVVLGPDDASFSSSSRSRPRPGSRRQRPSESTLGLLLGPLLAHVVLHRYVAPVRAQSPPKLAPA